jgi:hypothetical protein
MNENEKRARFSLALSRRSRDGKGRRTKRTKRTNGGKEDKEKKETKASSSKTRGSSTRSVFRFFAFSFSFWVVHHPDPSRRPQKHTCRPITIRSGSDLRSARSSLGSASRAPSRGHFYVLCVRGNGRFSRPLVPSPNKATPPRLVLSLCRLSQTILSMIFSLRDPLVSLSFLFNFVSKLRLVVCPCRVVCSTLFRESLFSYISLHAHLCIERGRS